MIKTKSGSRCGDRDRHKRIFVPEKDTGQTAIVDLVHEDGITLGLVVEAGSDDTLSLVNVAYCIDQFATPGSDGAATFELIEGIRTETINSIGLHKAI